MINLDELARRFMRARDPRGRSTPPEATGFERQRGAAPPGVLNGFSEVLSRLGTLEKRLAAVEAEVVELRNLVTPLHNR